MSQKHYLHRPRSSPRHVNARLRHEHVGVSEGGKVGHSRVDGLGPLGGTRHHDAERHLRARASRRRLARPNPAKRGFEILQHVSQMLRGRSNRPQIPEKLSHHVAEESHELVEQRQSGPNSDDDVFRGPGIVVLNCDIIFSLRLPMRQHPLRSAGEDVW